MKKSCALLTALFVVAVLCTGAYAEQKKILASSDTVSKDYLEKELANLKAENSQKQMDDYRETTSVVLTVQGFLITLLLGGIGYLAIKVYRFDKEAKDIKEKAESYAKDAQASSGIAHATSDEIQKTLTASRVRVDGLIAEAETKFSEKLQKMEKFVNQAEASEKSAKVSQLLSEGFSFFGQGRYSEALAAYEKAIALDPKSSVAFNNKGVALAKLGRYDEALAWHQKSLELDPNNASALYNKACIYALLNRKEDMLKWLKEAITHAAEYKDMAAKDEDFASYRDDPDFKAIVGG